MEPAAHIIAGKRHPSDGRQTLDVTDPSDGTSIGLMLMLVTLGVMSVTWMAVIAVLVLAQKLLPPRVAIDVPLALALVGLGILIVASPSSVPGLTAGM